MHDLDQVALVDLIPRWMLRLDWHVEAERPAFPLVRGRMVGLPGFEPGTSSLSEMDSRALCYPAFALVVRLRKSYRDGVNPFQVTLTMP